MRLLRGARESTLLKLRNMLVHFRPLDKIRYEEGRFSNTYPAIVKGLQQRGLARQLPEGCVTSWTVVLLTEKLAAWACDTSWNMIRAVIDMLPGLPGTVYGVIFNPEKPFGLHYSPKNPG